MRIYEAQRIGAESQTLRSQQVLLGEMSEQASQVRGIQMPQLYMEE